MAGVLQVIGACFFVVRIKQFQPGFWYKSFRHSSKCKSTARIPKTQPENKTKQTNYKTHNNNNKNYLKTNKRNK